MTDRTAGMDGTDVTGGRTVTLADMLRIPFRRWPFPLAGALLGLLAGVGYLLLPASYEATAVVAVRPVVTEPFSYPGPGADRVVNMTVENGLATGTDVVAAVAGATGQSATDARAGLTVELPVGSQVLRFRYLAPDSGDAVAGANAAATAYLTLRKDIHQRQRDAIVASYDASLKTLAAERDAIRRGLPTKLPASGGNSAAVSAQLDRLRGLDDRLGELTTRRAVAAAVDVTPGTVTRVAAPPVSSSHDMGPILAATALLGGALFGAVAAFGREALDRRVRSGVDAVAATRLPVLAELHVPRFRPDRERHEADVRYLALALVGQLGPVPHRRLVVFGLRTGDRTGHVAVELARSLAELGNTVRWEELSAEAGPVPDGLVPAGGPPEVADLDQTQEIRSTGPVPIVVGRPKKPAPEKPSRARSLPAGAGRIWLDPPPEPDETMITVVRAGAAQTDDRGVRAALEAAAVLVVRRDQTRVPELSRLADVLRLTGARVLGVVLVSGHD
ncbi:lipopolysaccharide biosynthesis protein [Paractinoplanes rishiriensis]|uniref:Polysaccharide chain length determinant N-terminal domain-containing protein n=1 Tax=Paractinoplanes rishiriensis TaxID=1050105 RepID=A0A919K1I8_9ACTN|nr:lipopolysaccharide biosynthesis protein [Actinoplanes rishiriensis]GIE98563.1 hypothetical protein Ari01nite_60280 [Actinoplanes rishiriensis]